MDARGTHWKNSYTLFLLNGGFALMIRNRTEE